MTEKLYSAITESDIRDNLEKLNTPLHWAVSFSNREAINFLVGEFGETTHPVCNCWMLCTVCSTSS